MLEGANSFLLLYSGSQRCLTSRSSRAAYTSLHRSLRTPAAGLTLSFRPSVQLMRQSKLRNIAVGVSVPVVIGMLLTSCAYRLPASNFPSEQRLRLIAQSPQQYVIRVDAYQVSEHVVACDGRVTVPVPRLPRACGVYLFDHIKISGGTVPSKTRAIQVVAAGKVKRKLSLDEVSQLPLDPEGFRLVKVGK